MRPPGDSLTVDDVDLALEAALFGELRTCQPSYPPAFAAVLSALMTSETPTPAQIAEARETGLGAVTN